MAITRVRAKLPKSLPTTPFKKMMGINTITKEAVEAKRAKMTILVPTSPACKGSKPSSYLLLNMLSSTTMASSMTMPTATARARRVKVFKEFPSWYIKKTVPKRVIGMAKIGTSVSLRLPRKK